MHKIVKDLEELIKKHRWQRKFNEAIKEAKSHKVHDFPELKTWKNYHDYLHWLDVLVTWAPHEKGDTRFVYEKIVQFYFIVSQPSVVDLQTPLRAGGKKVESGEKGQKLSPLSKWIVKFARAWGSYLDTLDSAKEVRSFKDDPVFNWDEYMPPPASYAGDPKEDYKAYRTFNQFFARHVKPGMRPVAGLSDDSVLVAPADSAFAGWWQISEQSEIYVEPKLHIKGLQWLIHELLEGSEYKDRFRGGIFTHSFLNTFDYHRWHSPVRGRILESRVVQGQAYLDVGTKDAIVEIKGKEEKVKVLAALDGTGYQFVQTRGLVVIDSPIGLVACLPMGMAQVSSVVLTAGKGVTVQKGEELGYFQFGGSDFVMVFERSSNVDLTGQLNVHQNQGSCIGRAYPQ